MVVSAYKRFDEEVKLSDITNSTPGNGRDNRKKNVWTKRSTCEKALLVTSITITSMTVIIISSLIYLSNSNNTDTLEDVERANRTPRNDICQSCACTLEVETVLRKVDKKVDPCDNFYKFACQGFIQTTVVPQQQPSVSAFSDLQDSVLQQLKLALEEPIQRNEPEVYRLTKTYYQACMNERKIEERGSKPLRDALKQLGGWPVLEGASWNEATYDWKETIYKLRDAGFISNRFLTFAPELDLKNSSLKTLSIDQGSFGFYSEYLREGLSNSFVADYYKYAVDVAVTLGADRSFAEKELREALLFSVELAKASQTKLERRNITRLYNPMTITEMEEHYPSIPWLEYMNRLLTPSSQITSNEQVIVHATDYVKKLEDILVRSSKRVQANWLIWTAVALSVKSMNQIFVKQQTKYWRIFSGAVTRPPRWMECIKLTKDDMKIGVGSLYVKNYFDRDSKIGALLIIESVRAELLKKLHNVIWMDEETRTQAINKANSMKRYIGYPEELADMETIGTIYEGLDIRLDTHFENQMKLRSFYTNKAFNTLRDPIIDWQQRANPATINAQYQPQSNAIDIPAGILQRPFFSKDRPSYLNYGSIGFIIGHEVTHGFDNIGRQFDKDGNLRNWWAKETENLFLEKTGCIVDQYSNYTVEQVGLNVNGVITQGENIADNGGVKLAYNAYIEWSKTNGEEPGLKCLPYTPRQLFWISLAQTWCFKYTSRSLKPSLVIDNHSPGEFRIIGSLSNSKEFADDFKCPLGSKMNPTKKCQVW